MWRCKGSDVQNQAQIFARSIVANGTAHPIAIIIVPSIAEAHPVSISSSKFDTN